MSGDVTGDQSAEGVGAAPADPFLPSSAPLAPPGGAEGVPSGYAAAPAYPPPAYPPPPGYGYAAPPGYGYADPPAGPPATDGFAIAALVFGIIGGILFAFIFGFVALSRIKKSRGSKTGRGLAIAGLTLGCVWVVGWIVLASLLAASQPSRDPITNAVVDGGKVSVNDVAVGDCLAEVLSEGNVTSVQVVPCSESHHGEAFATFTLPDGGYPGEEGVITAAEDGCSDRIPEDLDDSLAETLDLYYLYPKKANWALGDRDVLCIASSTGVLTGPIAP